MNKANGFESISQFDSHSDQPYIRIAVSNFVWKTNNELVGLLSRSITEAGEKKLGLIGGGALLFHDKNDLKTKGAIDFEGKDARFKIPLEKIDNFIDAKTGDIRFLCEQDVMRELHEELTQELIHGMKSPILRQEELKFLRPEYIGMFNDFEGVSRDAIQRGTNFRIINLFNIQTTDEIFQKIKNASVTYNFNQEDIDLGHLQGDEKILLKPFLTKAAHFVREEQRKVSDEFDY